jgi:prepilin-type processing-associated H-X9-DG protein
LPYRRSSVPFSLLRWGSLRRWEGDSSNWGVTYSFRSRHTQGLQFAYADGSVHFISQSIDIATYRAMATIAGGETLAAP